MKIPLNWLNEFIDIDTCTEPLDSARDKQGRSSGITELCHRLTMAGIETYPVKNISVDKNVVVAKILSIEKHPNADKLSVCNVTDSQDNYKIVCGAKNIKVGDIVPLAKVGAKLPCGEIKKAVLRGTESEGMLCSASELKIGDDASGILILPGNTKTGTAFNEYINKDLSIQTDVTINRGDCLSVFGIAREISAIFSQKLKKEIKKCNAKSSDIFPVLVENSNACPRYAGVLIKNIKVGKSPQWLIGRLRSCGLREINNVVDITNYILLEYGQPLHAFDVDKVKNKIIVRCAAKNEKIAALDNKEYILDEEMLVIADEKNPIAIAGVIGGEPASVSENTKNVFLEAACFDPISIRKTAKKLALSTDSSNRFIRGIDTENILNTGMLAAEMIQKICGGEISEGIVDIYPNPKEPAKVELNTKKVNKILNTEISVDEMKNILIRLGFSYTLLPTAYCLSVSVPSHRNDVKADVDVIEEIARIYGYDKIKTSDEIRFKTNITGNKAERVIDKIRNISVSLGFYETISYNFVSENDLLNFEVKEGARRISNPISAAEPFLATSLIPGLIKNTVRNINRGNSNIRFFEIGKVFRDKEKTFFSGCVYGCENSWWKQKAVAYDFYFIKGFIESVLTEVGVESWKLEKNDSNLLQQNQSVEIFIKNKDIGNFGLVNPEVVERFGIKNGDLYVFELDLDKLIYFADFDKRYIPIPRFPSIERDISIQVSHNFSADDICGIIRAAGGDILANVNVSDFYMGKQIKEKHKSLTFSMGFQLPDRTLKEEEVNSAIKKIILRLEKKFQAKLR